MKRVAALGALATLSLLAGCATNGGYYSGAYGYGGYPSYAYNYGDAPYYDNYGYYPYGYTGYPYSYGPTVGLGFSYYDYGGSRGGYRYRGGDRHWSGGNRPSNPPSGGLGPQAVGPQGAPAGGSAVAPRGERANTSMGRRRG